MRDFSKALAGVEVQNMDLDSLGLSGRTLGRIYTFLDEIVVRDYSLFYSTRDHESDLDNLIEWRERSRKDIDSVLRVFWPNIDNGAPSCLTIWPVVDAREKGRPSRSSMKVGRALRRMFPVLTDMEVDNLVDLIKSKLMSQEYNYFVAKDAVAFKKAYSSEQAKYANLETSHAKKHMANSCMRYEFDNLHSHPAEFYASGDFEMHWIETLEGKIAGRCVVAVAKAGAKIAPQPAPVYAVCEDSYEFLWAKLKERGCLPVSESNWVGCHLNVTYVNREDSSDGFIGAYLDLDPRAAKLSDCETKLVITARGEVNCSAYSGILFSGDQYSCDNCGEGVDESDLYYDPDGNGYSYCQDCYHERYANCENCNEDYSRVESSEVMTSRNSWCETWCDSCCSNHAVGATDGNLWSEDDVTLVASGDYVTQDELDDNYFYCSLVLDWYHVDQIRRLSNGEVAALESIEDHNRSFDTKYIWEAVTSVYIIPEEQEINLEESEAQSA